MLLFSSHPSDLSAFAAGISTSAFIHLPFGELYQNFLFLKWEIWVKVNEEIPDEVFTLPISHADSYVDYPEYTKTFYRITSDTLSLPQGMTNLVGADTLLDESILHFQPTAIYFGHVDESNLSRTKSIRIFSRKEWFGIRLKDPHLDLGEKESLQGYYGHL
jgi:hypothetical protein